MSDGTVVGVRSIAPGSASPTTAGAEVFCEITPEPSDEELAAVVVALALAAHAEAQVDHGHARKTSHWAMAGRHAAMRGLVGEAWPDWGKWRRA